MSEDSSGFDVSAAATWIYPTNLPVRDYQYNIVQHALFKNTLVCLPTGLGKTFIAAVVMYNFFRWYPQGKIVFMTPTRPLVAQQIDACYNVMGIPQEDMTEMTGSQQPASRAELWRTKRIFFLTAQVFMNDLSRGACDGTSIKCLVIDEAHKAQKNHAYCQVVRDLLRVSTQFRVLALSATPGNDLKDVQQVINNILISHVAIRSEESIDVQPYTHHKQVEKVVVTLDGNLSSIVDKYIKICGSYVSRLQDNRVLFNQAPANVTKFMLLTSREKFRQEAANRPPAVVGRIEGDFSIAMSLYHGLELVQLHGPRSLYNFLQGVLHGDKASPRVRNEFMRNEALMGLFNELGAQFDPNRALPDDPSGAPPLPADLHPKMKAVDEIVLKHFMDCQSGVDGMPKESRVIVFAQYRDTVDEIKRLLERHRPLIKPVVFIGHGTATSEKPAASAGAKKGRGRGSKAAAADQDENSNDGAAALPVPGRVAAAKMSQKDQLLIMERFRRGDFNTLVATSIVEEGLDIGEVDLIICYDAHRSPIRLVQRMGRTGRKRDGKCVMLVTAGREDNNYEQGVKKKRSLIRSIENARNTLQLYAQNPRMVPDEIKPQPLLIEVKPPPRTSTFASTSAGRGRGRGRSVSKRASKTTARNSALKFEAKDEQKSADLSSIFEDVVDEDFKMDVDSRPPDFEPDSESNDNKKPEVVHLDPKPTTSKRKRTKLERSESSDLAVGGAKQRKVYEFFAAPAKSASDLKENDDDVVFVENAQASNLACSLKNRLISIVEDNTIPGEETSKFNDLVFNSEPKSESFEPPMISPAICNFRSPVSWSCFNVDGFVTDVLAQLDELDFTKMVQETPMFLSPVGAKLQKSSGLFQYASTPKTDFAISAPKTASTASRESNNLSTSSEFGITQALDFLSVATPANKNSAALPPPTTAPKQTAPPSAVRNRYISPIIESLAAAFRRKQQNEKAAAQVALEQQKPPTTITFDIDFDMDISSGGGNECKIEVFTEQDKMSPVNFDLEFDFGGTSDEPSQTHQQAPMSSTFREPLDTVVEQPESFRNEVKNEEQVEEDEIALDADLLEALTRSPEFEELEPEIVVPSASSFIINKPESSPIFSRTRPSFQQTKNEIISPVQPQIMENSPISRKPMPVIISPEESEVKVEAVTQFKAPPRPTSEMENSPILRRPKPGKNKLEYTIGPSSSKFGKFASFPQPAASSSNSIYFADDDDDDFKTTSYSNSKANFDKPSTSSTKWMSKPSSSTSKLAVAKSFVESPGTLSPSPVVQKKKKKKRPNARQFLETQAEQSDTASSDDDNSDDDRDLSGFVDHNHDSPPDTQDHAMYLRMQIDNHRTPQFGNGRFKLVYKQNQNNTSIFSQTPGQINNFNEEDDSYVEDSFCVGDDFVEFEESSQTLDLISPSQPKPRTRGAQRKKGAEIPNRRRKVIISDDEEGEGGKNQNQIEEEEDVDLAIAISRSLEDLPTRAVVKPLQITPQFLQNSPEKGESSFIPGPESPLIMSQTAKRVKKQEEDVSQKIVIFTGQRDSQSGGSVLPVLRAAFSSIVCPIVRPSWQTPGLDYVFSCRSAAVRVKLASLLPPTATAQSRKKATDEITSLASLVDLPVVIIEASAVINESSKLQVSKMLAPISSRRLQILYSEDVTQTAAFLVDLAKQEDVEGAAVRLTETALNSNTALVERMKFFESGGAEITPVVALKMALGFPNLQNFLSAHQPSSNNNVDLSKFSTCARQALTRLRVGQTTMTGVPSSNNNINKSANQAAVLINHNNGKVSSKQLSSGGFVRRS